MGQEFGKDLAGWFWLWDSIVRWWLVLTVAAVGPEQQSGRSWLRVLLSPCGLRASASDLCSWTSLGFLTTWWPQHSQTASMAAKDFKREVNQMEAMLPFMI